MGKINTNSDSDSEKLNSLRIGELIDDLDELETQEQNKTRLKVSAKIQIRVGNKQIKALVDTGAQINPILTELYKELVNTENQ